MTRVRRNSLGVRAFNIARQLHDFQAGRVPKLQSPVAAAVNKPSEYMMQPSDYRKAFYDIVKDFRFAILVSQSSGERPHGRPMSIAEISDDGTVYFSTSIESGKVAEIQNDCDVLLTFQSRLQFAILEGVATVSHDRALIARLWKQDWNLWYPGGKDDPSIAIICVTPTSGEYWDQSGLNGAKFLFQAVKAVVTGTQPQVSGEQHAKVEL